jgi:GntR family transcriptional repressor for pyruvate dehydrogenase complex
MPVDSTNRKPVYATVQTKLRAFVRDEQITRGERLPSERELAGRLGVSRTSLRQALTALRIEGLIDVRHGDGIYLLRDPDDVVPPITAALVAANPELPALGEVRNALEAQGAAWAAIRRDDADLAEMVEALRMMEREILEHESGLSGDRRFHAAVLAAARNPILLSVLDVISDGAVKIAQASLARPAQPERSLAAHRLILDAIVAREPEMAQRLMFDHLDLSGAMEVV